MTDRITAVVTVADDGGSSGRLREELGVLPPGDLRMALAALCDDSDWGRTWRDLLQHRFRSSGDLDQHAVGQPADRRALGAARRHGRGPRLGRAGCSVRAAGCCRWRRCRCGSRPTWSTAPAHRSLVVGQSAVAVTTGTIEPLRLDPADPPACPEAVEAIEAADWIVLGPGSWYTSVLPHLLVPEPARGTRANAAPARS